MHVLNKTDEYDIFINCTDNDNDDIIIIIKFLLLSVPSSILLLFFLSLTFSTRVKPLINGKVFLPTTPSSLFY